MRVMCREIKFEISSVKLAYEDLRTAICNNYGDSKHLSSEQV